MKPSKRFEWLLLYSLVWTMMVLTGVWLWGDLMAVAGARLLASIVLAVGDVLIAAYLWWRFQPDGKKKERGPPAPAGGAAPGGGQGLATPEQRAAAAKAAGAAPVSPVKAS